MAIAAIAIDSIRDRSIVTAAITEGDDGSVRLKLDIADDAPIGVHGVTYEIAEEPEPVRWTIQILPR